MKIKIAESNGFKYFPKENWKLFLENPVSSALLKIITTDITIVKTLFTRCLEQTLRYINHKTLNKKEMVDKLQILRSVCDNNLGDKKMFDSLFNEMLKDFAGYYYGYLKKNGGDNTKELLEFGYLMKIIFNRKKVFKWKVEEPLDFLKLYEDIDNTKITSINSDITN